MAQSGFTPISLYYSSTAAATPIAANLITGELAINVVDGKLFYKDSSGVVQTIASKATGTIGGFNTQVQYNNAGLFAGSANMTFDGTKLTVAGLKDSALTSGRVTYATTSGELVDSANLTFNGTTLTAGGLTTAGAISTATLTASGVVTVTNLSASQAVFTNGSDQLVSNAITGTGNVVMSASPTLTGTVNAAAITASGTVAAATLTATGTVSGATVTSSGAVNTVSLVASGDVTGNGNWIIGNADTDTVTLGAAFVNGTTLKSAKTATNTLALAAYDVDGASYTNLVTLTASNTPTLALTSTGVGTINNMSIGATTASTGAFTNFTASGTATFTSTGAVKAPVGTTAERPTPATGMIRYNSSNGQFEGYYASTWGQIGGGATGGGGNQVFVLNDQTVTVDYTIPTGKNASSAGPITIDTGITVTVPTDSTWVIV
jgi:hypothetical protein